MNKLTIFKELHDLNLKFKCNLQELQENDVLLTFHLHYEFPTISIHRFDRDCFIEEFVYLIFQCLICIRKNLNIYKMVLCIK